MVPSARITSVLADVHSWTGFANAFTHLHTGMPADDPRVILTSVLADATNLGLTRMADACSVAGYRELAWTAGWHLREDTYRQALAMVVNAQQRQPLATRFGFADVSSSDGQAFLTAGHGEALGAHNARHGHGREPSALFYPHVSSRHAPFHTASIPPSGEAAYVIDGLLYHEADLSIAVHHTDGGGVSDHVFALAHLLGFRFAPRIPNLADRKLYAFGPASTWPALAPFVAGRPDEKLITAQWDDVLRLAASVRTGTVSASLMLKRLGAYPRQNGLALALREIGRVERTLHALNWLEQPQLRRQATAELNKGESHNALARAVCFHRLGRLHDRTTQAQQHRASGLALVTAAIVLWNTVYLGRALDVVRRRGDSVPDELLAHLAPLGWQHINLTGDYLWGADAGLGPGRIPAAQGRFCSLAHRGQDSGIALFSFRATNRAILPVLWRTPGSFETGRITSMMRSWRRNRSADKSRICFHGQYLRSISRIPRTAATGHLPQSRYRSGGWSGTGHNRSVSRNRCTSAVILPARRRRRARCQPYRGTP